MKFKANRFAIFPHLCSECKQYIWMEAYRKAEVWKMDRFIVRTLCQDCLGKMAGTSLSPCRAIRKMQTASPAATS